MYRVVILQFVGVLVAAGLASIWLGQQGALSVLLGGMAYAIPNLLFVARLTVSAAKKQTNAVTFFVGELVKVLATVVILVVAQRFYPVHWLALLVGLFVALKANLFALLLKN
ncbi:MAG: ATP synthase subunit I [Rugosibacter sp.]|jgi:ATP synthase protein I|nr:ATP synthase subunit I [Rugosibacter sp.]